ncbi:GNAT family N-acetyltransferase [Vibrio rotiferianus]
MTSYFSVSAREWDSFFFKRNICDVNWPQAPLPSNTHFELITTKVPCTDAEKLSSLNKHGFSYCEGELVFTKKVSKSTKEYTEVATTAHMEGLLALIPNLYQHSRFKAPWFSPQERDYFYQEWLQKAIIGAFDDVCLIINQDNLIKGFITLKVRQQEAVIGLLGVNPLFSRKGVARMLLDSAEWYAHSRGAANINVATQSSNIPAMNLYLKSGYSISSSHVWLYKS